MGVVRFPHPPDPGAVAAAEKAHRRRLADVETALAAVRDASEPVHGMLKRLPRILQAQTEAVEVLVRYIAAVDDAERAAAAADVPPAIRAAADHDNASAQALVRLGRATADVAEPQRNARTIAREALAAIIAHANAVAATPVPPLHPAPPPPNF